MLRTGGAVNENIEHRYLVCEERDKPDVLRKLLHALPEGRAMVFVHRNDTAETVAAKLAHHKIAVANLHAAADKLDRKQAMDDIRSGRVRVLITSDVAARGLDIADVADVINFDVPTQSKAYLHRVGRTARAGAKGCATTLMTADEVRLVTRFETELGIVMHRVRLREGQLIAVGAEGVAGPLEPLISCRCDPSRAAWNRLVQRLESERSRASKVVARSNRARRRVARQ